MRKLIRAGVVVASMALIPFAAHAQERLTEHTFKAAAGAAPPPATIADIAWFAGHWMGAALGGVSEEIWSPPDSGSMMGMYRLILDGKPVFYELLTLVEENGSLMLRLKHFNADLTGWEDKDRTEDFPLVATEGKAMHFEGVSFHPDGENAATIYLAIRQEDGSHREEVFQYTRVRAAKAP